MSSAPTSPRFYTARQLAARLGRDPRGVARQLVGIPAGRLEKPAHSTWSVPAYGVPSLPQSLRDEISARARRHRTIEDFLDDARSQWTPEVPVKDCIDADIDFAARLQRALLPFLHDEQLDLSAEEFKARGAEAHRIAFDRAKPVSSRHWWRLYQMVLERARGDEDFARLELFLPLRQTRRGTPADVVQGAVDECFDLSAAVRGCADPLNPTDLEWEVIARRACEQLEAIRLSGRTPKQAMRQLGEQLVALPPFIRDSRESIRCWLRRCLAKWRAGNGSPDAVADGRAHNTGNHDNYEFPIADYEELIGCAVWRHDGDVAAAWRECWHGGKFTPATMKHFGRWTRSRKSDVPKSVMQEVRFPVDVLRRWRLGWRGYNSARAWTNLADTPIPPMVIISGDDMTPDCYYGVEISPGRDRMVRGQVLLFIDFGTLRIIGFVITPASNYNALMILGELTRIFRDIAVPAAVGFEKGIWERAYVVKGRSRAAAPQSPTAREGRFERLGVRFTHALSAQGKTRMERTIKAVQELLRAEPGGCGNDERVTCPEETRRLIDRVNSGELRARQAGFHDAESFELAFKALCDRYNATRQEGKILKGRSPDEAWEQFFDPEYLPTRFTPELEHVLTEHVEEVKVTLNGIRLPFGKGVCYDGWELNGYRGQTVQVSLSVLDWSENGLPDKVAVCIPFENRVIMIPRKTQPSPIEWLFGDEVPDLRKARKENASAEAPYKELLKTLRPRFNTLKPAKPLRTRSTIGDAGTVKKGQALAESRGAQTASDRKRTRGHQLAGLLGGMGADQTTQIEHGRNLRESRARDAEAQRAREEADEERARAELAAKKAEIAEFERNNAHLFT